MQPSLQDLVTRAVAVAASSTDPEARRLADAVLGFSRAPTIQVRSDFELPVRVFGVLLSRLADVLDGFDPPKPVPTDGDVALPSPMDRLHAGHGRARAMLLRVLADAVEFPSTSDHTDLFSLLPPDMQRRFYRLPDDRLRQLLADHERDARLLVIRERMRLLMQEVDGCTPQGS
ncbi:MAG: hypothetical protein JNM07_02610 [Phycisphaerae bacterium]|nr:hypothetical protein [Phycisphaerae bacterium]